MENLWFYYDFFQSRIGDVKKYIRSIELQKIMIREMSENKERLGELTDNILQYTEIIKNVAVSPIQYNAVIISIYGCFEQYIDKVFDCYCRNLCDVIERYDEIPDKLKDKQIKRLGDFLVNPQRYKNYGLEVYDAVKNAWVSFENPKAGIMHNKRLLLSHGGNLRIDQVADLAADFGINDFLHKVVRNYKFKQYFISREKYNEELYEKNVAGDPKVFFEELEYLVEARNNVAHGWVEERRDFCDIREKVIDYLEILAETITEILSNAFAEYLCDIEKVQDMGKPLKVFDNHIVCINNGDIALKLGDYLIASNEKNKKMLKIETMEIAGKSIDRLNEHDVNVGIGLEIRQGVKINKNYTFYYFCGS